MTKQMHMQNSRNGLALHAKRAKNERCQAALEPRRATSTTMLQRVTTADIQAHRNE